RFWRRGRENRSKELAPKASSFRDRPPPPPPPCRRGRRRRLQPANASPSPSISTARPHRPSARPAISPLHPRPNPREFLIVQSPSKLCVTSGSAQPAVSGLHGWADLPDGLLESIIALSGSFRDLLAFAATCHSWPAAFSSYPSKSSFCTKFLPLLIQFNACVQAPDLPSSNGLHELHTFKVIDPTNKNVALRCQIPRDIYHEMDFVGNSYGQLIFRHGEYCLLVDVFNGAEVSAPPLPFNRDFRGLNCSGTLTAPLASPNSHLLVSTVNTLFDWPVGSESWSELQLHNTCIVQIVELKGQFIAMDDCCKIYTLQLSPELGLQKMTCVDLPITFVDSWLVVCGDMLLMITKHPSFPKVKYIPYQLDLSTNPAKWVEVKQLNDWALFVGCAVRSRPFSCMSLERWGGRSKSLYFAGHHSFVLHGLGIEGDVKLEHKRNWLCKLQPLWVYPRMFYSDSQ
ncbi:uncharacterized protein, partial [Triticum aestivum]|uniref:uncharacterized protein n=1 Tax=Triticum aestivum TaxID=4565 RepID=UPI001D034A7D